MNWLPPQYRILYSSYVSKEVFDKLKEFLEQSCLCCKFENKIVAIITDMKLKNNQIMFILFETLKDGLSKINSEQYYLKLNYSQDYIRDTTLNLSNILTIEEK